MSSAFNSSSRRLASHDSRRDYSSSNSPPPGRLIRSTPSDSVGPRQSKSPSALSNATVNLNTRLGSKSPSTMSDCSSSGALASSALKPSTRLGSSNSELLPSFANVSSGTRSGGSSSGLFRSSTKMSRRDIRSYNNTRHSLYGDKRGDPTSSAKRDRNRYSKAKTEANKWTTRYFDALKEEKGGDEDRSITGLQSGQHGRLLRPSARAASFTASHAQARERFLVDHPYGYDDYKSRQRHEGFADGAFAEARDTVIAITGIWRVPSDSK